MTYPRAAQLLAAVLAWLVAIEERRGMAEAMKNVLDEGRMYREWMKQNAVESP